MLKKSQIMVLVSGHRDTAERMAAYCVLSRSIYNDENCDEILTNPGIAAIYIALPNSMYAD